MKWLGALLLGAASLYAYIERERGDREHLQTLNSLLSVLNVMRAELSERLTPTPQLVEILRRRSSGRLESFFDEVAGALGTDSDLGLSEAWTSAIEKLDLGDRNAKERLSALGGTLGRYSIDEQLRSIELAHTALSEYYAAEQKRCSDNRRLYLALYFMPAVLLFIILI